MLASVTTERRCEAVFDRAIDRVWHAITDSRMLARWLMDNDFVPVASRGFTLRGPATDSWRGWIDGKVLELDPPHRMVWVWNDTAVAFELVPHGTGTRLVLRHAGDESDWRRRMEWLKRALGDDYARRLAFRSPRESVYEAITTLDGLRGWWTTRVSGDASLGGEMRFEFPGATDHIVMRVDLLEPPTTVRWTALEHGDFPDWAGTTVRFDLAAHAGGCELGFMHLGLSDALPCWAVCQPGWDRYLASLVSYVDDGRGSPWSASR